MSESLDTLGRVAIDVHGVLLIPELGYHPVAVDNRTLDEWRSLLEAQAGSLHSEDSYVIHCLGYEASSFLRLEVVCQLQSSLSKFLRSLSAGLRLSDVKTEVLASWLAETSDSSSGCADGESARELPTPSRNDDALPLKHTASVDVFPSEEKGEHP